MNKNTKILLGILSFIPFLAIAGYFFFIFKMIILGSFSSIEGDNPMNFFRTFIPLFLMMGIGVLVGLGLFVYYLICAIRDVSASENDKLLWILLLVFLSYLVYPFYWYIRIWSNPDFSLKKVDKDIIDGH